MGHLNQSRAGVRSTKRKINPLPEATEDDLKPLLGKKLQDVYFKVVDTWDPKYKVYSDQTGQFSVRSRAGYWYIMVMVKIDSNYALLQPMNNKSDKAMVEAYEALMKRLRRAGIVSKKHVLDNECSENLKELICVTCILELVPPGCHRRNIAEVAIKSFKQHFLSILAGLPDDFPWSL